LHSAFEIEEIEKKGLKFLRVLIEYQIEAKPYSAPITEYGFQKNRDQQSVLVIDPGLTLIRITETKS
jgi:hypothetical protein